MTQVELDRLRITSGRADPIRATGGGVAEPLPRDRSGGKLLGIALALLAGVFAGAQSVPAALHAAAHPEEPAEAVLAQCAGAWAGASFLYLCDATCARPRGGEGPPSGLRPAYVCGCLWAVGFLLMVLGIGELGFAIAYTIDAAGPSLVSSLLSLFVYQEIRGPKQLLLYTVALTLQLVGVVMIAACGQKGEKAQPGPEPALEASSAASSAGSLGWW